MSRAHYIPDLQGTIGLADLACALASGDERLVAGMAALLRVSPRAIDVTGGKTSSGDREPSANASGVSTKTARVEIQVATGDIDPVPFWRLSGYRALAPRETEPEAIVPAPEPAPNRPAPRHVPLAEWSELQPGLRRLLRTQRPGRQLDVDEYVRRVSRGERLRHLPRRRHAGWGQKVIIVVDRSEHLTPYWRDQEYVVAALVRLLPAHGLKLAVYQGGWAWPRTTVRSDQAGLRQPDPGSLILVLGDLGCLARDDGEARGLWTDCGNAWRNAGCTRLALLPCATGWVSGELASLYALAAWRRAEQPMIDPADGRRAIEAILRLLSLAIRIEPGLLRAVRLSLGGDAPEAGVEALCWQHHALPRAQRSSIAATLDLEAAEQLRASLKPKDRARLRAAIAGLREWRANLPAEIWHEEVLSCAALGLADLLPDPDDLPRARAFYRRLSQQGRGVVEGASPGALDFYRRSEDRLPDQAWRDPVAGADLQKLTWLLHKEEADYAHAHRVPPDIGDVTEGARHFQVSQRAGDLRVWQQASDVSTRQASGSPLCRVTSRSGRIDVLAGEEEFWRGGQAPSWADGYGLDEFGAWVEFVIPGPSVGGVRQCLRWIPPGEFLMGSPKDEPGRWEDEGPQHPVSIEQGYWLFDTPCTQALWQAVTGTSPSHFTAPERPVERVNIEDLEGFFDQLNRLLPGLDLGLPSEAQWEYACRAGTTSAVYTGDLAIADDAAPVLDAIAWFDANSNGESHPVKRKQANPWGLHDMLGNVWEWTVDVWYDDYRAAPREDKARTGEAGARRVVRGGSWSSEARLCRAACRFESPPDERINSLGFRPARVQPEPASQAAEPVLSAPARRAERRVARTAPGAATALLLRGDRVEDACVHPDSDFRIQTDCGIWTFEKATKPRWADAIGRDAFGLWAEIRLADSAGEVVRQRLRWIAPGEFQMGSPKGESGRYDNEGPLHKVILSQGYWLFDTACTQLLWQVVMGENPSTFKTPDRPIESISWEQCRAFLTALNSRIDGLNLTLPSEAQWEYACRAGSQSALYSGPIEILGDANAPALDEIAWYAGNSQQEFGLDNGIDLDFYAHRQYGKGRAGTHPVGRKAPNAWGLYDMLGNVWEWCLDGQRAYGPATEVDPVGLLEPGASRVVRGGSWSNGARDCRAACRGEYPPDERFSDLGFRPARVQS